MRSAFRHAEEGARGESERLKLRRLILEFLSLCTQTTYDN